MDRRRFAVVIGLLTVLCVEDYLAASDQDRIPLRVLYLSRTKDDSRTSAFKEFLTLNFASCRTESRESFQRELTNDIDVVVLDWSQDERLTNETVSPLGPLEDWKHPIVLLGSAGLLMSRPWKVIGDAG